MKMVRVRVRVSFDNAFELEERLGCRSLSGRSSHTKQRNQKIKLFVQEYHETGKSS